MLRFRYPLAATTFMLGGALLAPAAHAHINMDGVLQGRGGEQKAGPCEGKAWGSGTVYTFEPGATITIGVDEYIGHDGYFRIAFDNDGDDDFIDPMSIEPVNPNRYGTGKECEGTAADRCGESDFCSFISTNGGPTVLWDSLDPHQAGILGGRKWTWNITLPDVECERCTLQVMQIMEDPLGHGPFDGQNDLYYRCVDIVLERGAGNGPGTTNAPAVNNGIDCTQAQMTDAGVMLPDAEVIPVIPDAGAQPGEHSDHDHDAGSMPDAQPGSGGSGSPSESPMAPLDPGDGASSGCSVRREREAPGALCMLVGLVVLGRWSRRRHMVPLPLTE